MYFKENRVMNVELTLWISHLVINTQQIYGQGEIKTNSIFMFTSLTLKAFYFNVKVLLEQEGGLIYYTITLGLSFFRSCWHQMLCGLFSAQQGMQSWALYNTHSSSQFAVATDNRKCHQFHKQNPSS